MLTDEQRTAVETDATVALVTAVPGSGKTRVITERIINLLRSGVPGHAILAMTFSRAAAHEMRSRVEAACKEDGRTVPKGLTCTTIHGFCRSLFLGINVLDEATAKALFKWVLPKEDYHDWEVLENEYRPKPSLSLLPYAQELASTRSADYTKLLLWAQSDLTPMPKFSHVLVDEAQDCSPLQWSIIDRIAEGASLFIVGDENQSIYQWRYADPRWMGNVAGLSGGTRFPMTVSFRCPPEVCSAANTVIESGMVATINKLLFDSNFRVITGYRDIVATDINSILHRFAPRTCAVLCRTNRTADRYAKALRKISVPVSRGPSRKSVDPIIPSLLRIYLSPTHWPSLLCVLTREKIPPGLLAAVRAACNEGYEQVCELLSSAAELYPLAKVAKSCLLCSKIDIYCDNAGLLLAHCLPKGIDCPAAVSEMTVREALDYLSELDRIDLDAGEEGVTVCTAHAAKGREWRHVWVVELQDGDWPLKRGDQDEERRLLYVAMTRASQTLTLHYRGPEQQEQGRTVKPPSPFIMSLLEEK
jgi:DNA helicase-2/ATP-dependent DNA helicase PcrA